MITRFALFDGQVNPAETEAFRAAVLTEVLPHWKSFPGVLAVRVCFADERDDDAPELPLILAISYPDPNDARRRVWSLTPLQRS